jgi:hypothetical protein
MLKVRQYTKTHSLYRNKIKPVATDLRLYFCTIFGEFLEADHLEINARLSSKILNVFLGGEKPGCEDLNWIQVAHHSSKW